jgi:hypothetical protein
VVGSVGSTARPTAPTTDEAVNPIAALRQLLFRQAGEKFVDPVNHALPKSALLIVGPRLQSLTTDHIAQIRERAWAVVAPLLPRRRRGAVDVEDVNAFPASGSFGLPPAWYSARLAWTMIAAMAAAVSPISTLRLTLDPAGLASTPAGSAFCGKLTLVDGSGPFEGLRVAVRSGTCSAGPAKGTGLAKSDLGIGVAATGGGLLTGALWRPIE